MKYFSLAAITAFVALAAPSSVSGQESNNAWGGRAFLTFNVGAQTASPSFGYEYATTLFNQNATAGLTTPGKNAATFDLGGAVRLVQNLGIGVTYSRYSNQRTATLTTTIPSPAYYYYLLYYPYYSDLALAGTPSTIQQEMPLQREEDAVHIQAIYRVAIGRRIQVGAFGGPTHFRCLDDHVTKFQLEVVSSYPEWSVDFHDYSQLIDRGSAWGYHGGASFTYLATRHVGVGMMARYSQASHTTMNHFSDTTRLEDEGIWGGDKGTGSVTMKHGGMQWTGGVSFHF